MVDRGNYAESTSVVNRVSSGITFVNLTGADTSRPQRIRDNPAVCDIRIVIRRAFFSAFTLRIRERALVPRAKKSRVR